MMSCISVYELLHVSASQVVFEVSFNSARGGRVAIDDISFSPEFCSTDTGELQLQSLTVVHPNY